MRKLNSGVSLLETMIALMVMGFISVMIASSFGFYGKVFDRDDGHERFIGSAIARNDLSQWVRLMPGAPSIDGVAFALKGSATRMEFATVTDIGGFWVGGATLVSLERHENQLLVSARGALPDGTSHEVQPVIFDGATDLRISYYGTLISNHSKEWQSSWEHPVQLPDLVKIEANGDDGPMVPIVLRPGLNEDQRLRSLSSPAPPG
ncbi:hypothetical protein [Ruegeria sp. HKCCD8929]|uniref:hypothetical protein n=1 Tax=Ruegeria sp. HKCCD8929 TaxID=2683006 RepID=UPI001488A70A|nr:hypothetical protein [Ruegeria sp. HKCCD8929]